MALAGPKVAGMARPVFASDVAAAAAALLAPAAAAWRVRSERAKERARRENVAEARERAKQRKAAASSTSPSSVTGGGSNGGGGRAGGGGGRRGGGYGAVRRGTEEGGSLDRPPAASGRKGRRERDGRGRGTANALHGSAARSGGGGDRSHRADRLSPPRKQQSGWQGALGGREKPHGGAGIGIV